MAGIYSQMTKHHPKETVEIPTTDDQTADPVTLSQMFQQVVLNYPNKVAMCYKDDSGYEEQWKEVTFQQYFNLCLQVAKSFVKVTCQVL